MNRTKLVKKDGKIQNRKSLEKFFHYIPNGEAELSWREWSDSRGEQLSRFFHGPVIRNFIRFMQDHGYYQHESEEMIKVQVKEILKENFGPKIEVYDPIQKLSIRKSKSWASAKRPDCITQEEAIEMLSQLESKFSEWGIPWPEDEYKRVTEG